MLQVVASFYPLQFAAQAVGGDFVDVVNLTPDGVEPHDVDLTGQDIARLESSDLVVYLANFSPALDDAVGEAAPDHAFDVSPSARLQQQAGSSLIDPHFWLDPSRLADVGDALAAELSAIAPTRAAEFVQNAATMRDRLDELDGEFAAGLSQCVSSAIVTSHEAFGYLASRYDLTQIGISGLGPDEEPASSTLAEVALFVEDNGVSTIYYETLVDPSVAETIAAETGADTAVLDPIEGLNDSSAGADYFEVMRSNLASLRSGQGCT